MPLTLNRRSLILTGSLGLGAYSLIGSAAFAGLSGARGFTHNVASGEPAADSVLLWTRFVPADAGPVKLRAEISDTAEFTKIISGGQIVTGPWRDHTAKITVDGLSPGKLYFYRFIAPDGSKSPIGRTKTLPIGAVKNFNIAIFSCSNLGFGFFNAYAHVAARRDIDLVLHMGDYIYEYQRGDYDIKGSARALAIHPEAEIFTLADYRLRYASYRADPDLQAMHQNFAVIPNTDDHEGANDAWEGGAQNHQAEEGDWNMRRSAAMQVWREWMPVGETPWKSYDFGTLGSYLRTDSRLIARSRPSSYQDIIGEKEAGKALNEFRDGDWIDNAATMFGSEQENWIAHSLRGSVKSGQAWQIVGSGTVVGKAYLPKEASTWLAPDADKRAIDYMKLGLAAAQVGLPFNLDNWGGYPAARSRLLRSAQSAGANLIIVSGDSHNAWANDLIEDGKPVGVEFAGHSVSSPGYENFTKVDPKLVAAALVKASPELRWSDTSNRGYMVLSLTPTAATNEYIFTDNVDTRSLRVKGSKKLRVRSGRKVIEGI